jgi:hypothetical protein
MDRLNTEAIEAACNEACRDITQLIHSRKEWGVALPISEVLAVGLQRLLSYGVQQENLGECVDALLRKAEDLKFKKLLERDG